MIMIMIKFKTIGNQDIYLKLAPDAFEGNLTISVCNEDGSDFVCGNILELTKNGTIFRHTNIYPGLGIAVEESSLQIKISLGE